MKCPRCNYVSFDSMPRCKKCGYQFKPSASQRDSVSISSLVSDIPAGEGETPQIDADADLKKTVSSIRQTLAAIDGKSGDGPQDQPLEVDTGDLKFRIDSSYMDTSGQFPDGSEINWEESVSLSGDNVTLPFNDDGPEVPEADAVERPDDRAFTGEECVRGTLRKISEELKEIEEGPQEAESVLKGIEEKPILFDPPAGMAVPDEDAVAAPVSKGGFWIRSLAYLIDSVILEFLSLILIVVGMLAMSMSPSGLAALDEDRIMGLLGPYYLFSTIITILYFTYFHGSIGQTPGKMLCGLKVVRVNGEPLGFARALLRWAGYLPSSLVFGLGFLWIAWDRNKQAWHDKIAGTRVIRL